MIADHNDAFEPNEQATVRYTQAGATLPEDSITRWHERSALHTASLDLASHDYRSLAMRPQSQAAAGDAGNPAIPTLGLADVPGLYAYEDATQGERPSRSARCKRSTRCARKERRKAPSDLPPASHTNVK